MNTEAQAKGTRHKDVKLYAIYKLYVPFLTIVKNEKSDKKHLASNTDRCWVVSEEINGRQIS